MRIDDRMVFEIIGELSDVETSLGVARIRLPMAGLAWLKRMASARKSSRRSSTSTSARRFVVCVRNAGYAASLEQNKIYVAIPDEAAESHGQIRVVDESGEDYLFSADRFVAIEVPAAVRASLLEASCSAAQQERLVLDGRIQSPRLARQAAISLRQSSEKQGRQNKESQRLQYRSCPGLRDGDAGTGCRGTLLTEGPRCS